MFKLFSSFDLRMFHHVACLFGTFAAIYVSALWGRGAIQMVGDCPFSVLVRRAALTVLSLALLWSFTISLDMNWQPWPSDLMTILAVDLFLVSKLMTAYRRSRVFG